uniref:Globoside alpha-1,3-N-acetylgalactosaminyltransferase 1 (FORS blood group) n=1 Tax=Serinus canaria TaxID=9135 RepID=A0A8C9U6V4_SERCA
ENPRKVSFNISCLKTFLCSHRAVAGSGKVHYLPYYLPCPEILIEFLVLSPCSVQRNVKNRKSKPEAAPLSSITPALAEGQSRALPVPAVPHGLCLLRYTRFVRRFLDSAEQHFLRGYRVNYYIFTDSPQSIPQPQLQPGRSLLTVPVQRQPSWQEISMRRMEAISRHLAQERHRQVQYLFCLDIDMVFHNPWGPETLGDIVAAIHPGYFDVPREQFPYERRSSSAAFIPEGEGDFYYGGAVFGGLVEKVYEFTKMCHMTILADKANGIMAAWQEESHLNRHFLSHKPSKLLSPEYIWDDRKPKPPQIRLIRFSTVNKNYKEVRN